MGYSIYKVDWDTNTKVCLYDCIDDIKEVDLLAQLAMNNKRDDELIIIMPGWNRGIEKRPDEYNKALELAKEHKYER